MTNRRSVRFIFMLLLSCWLISVFQPACHSANAPSMANTTQVAPEKALESRLLSLLNQHRTQQGLPALVLDENLVRIARTHSNGMAQQGFISHDAPLGDLKTRLNHDGYSYQTARENVARSKTVEYAQNALLESPAHKSNILAVDVDRIGIGIVRSSPPCEKELYITEIFASPREDYQPAAVKDILLSKIDDLRQNGAGSLVSDPVLEKLASDSVQSLNLPVQKEDLQNLVSISTGELQKNGRKEIARVDASVQLLRNPKNIKILSSQSTGQAGMFGSAVRKVVNSQSQTTYLVLTLISFTK